ncbi:MAG: NAD-dependent epimerase/dehydratase family protein [Nitrospinae bacterium]|nr:NAD-dependent epimerase/dehydratase family protein [Nitrospinota bacterium]
MKALVTGGGGFLGRYIVEKLLAAGADVQTLSRNPQPELIAMGVKTFCGDVGESDEVMKATAGVDTVFHVAAKVGIGGNHREFHQTNVVGTRNVINACRAQGARKLVFTSSPSVVFDGKPHEGIDETYPYPAKHTAFYPMTKAIAEREVLEANGPGLLTCSLRPHLVWGPRDTNLIPRLLARAKAGRLRIVGDGANLIDTVYVENAADAHLLAAQRLETGSKVAGSAYFISQGEPVNCWEFVNRILEKLGGKPVTKHIPYPVAYTIGGALEFIYGVLGRNDEPPMTRFLAQQLAMPHYFNITKAREELGYTPLVNTEEGLERLAKTFQA